MEKSSLRKMSYYSLKCAVNTFDTGPIFPQIQKMSVGYDYNAKNSVYALSRKIAELPDFIPNLDSFIVHHKANLTDVLSNGFLGSSGFLINDKVKSIFSKFKLSSHKLYNAKVYYKKNTYPYYWLHIKSDILESVDFKKSSFVILLNYAHKIGNIDIFSIADYLEKKEKLKLENSGKTVSIWADKVVLSLNPEVDFFKIGTFDTDSYISETLKKSILNEEITGFQIDSSEKLIIPEI